MAHDPTRTTTISSHGQLRDADPAFQNFVIDRPVVYVPLSQQNAIVASLVGMGTGTPSVAEINSSGIGAYTLDADNESFHMLLKLPSDMDLAKQLDLRVLWSNSAAAATGTARFYFTYTPIVVGTTALATAASGTGTACDTDGAAQADLAANVLQWSTWSIINGGTLTGTTPDDMLNLCCYVDLTTITDASVYGINLRYYRRFLGGDS